MNHRFIMDLSNDKPPCLLLLLGLLLVQISPGALELKDTLNVTNTLSNSRPSLGDTITLNCNIIDEIANYSVAWWKDRHSLKRAVYVSYNCLAVAEQYKARLKNIKCDRNQYNFQLSNVKESDSGKWQCEADGAQANTVLDLDVLVPHNVKVKIKKTTVKEDEFVRFECATSGGKPEKVTRYQWLWKKSGSDAEQVIRDTPNEKFLQFTRIQYNRSGTYSCKAWNDGGMGQASTVLNVQYSPRIDPEAKMKYEVAAHMGGEAMFELLIIANPTPNTTDYVWSKGDEILVSGPDFEITSGSTSSKLKIKAVKPSDYQNYSCSVETSRFSAKVFNFKLFKADPLPAPSRLKEVTSTAVSATLKWISESPNGTEQRFYIQYKKSAESWEKALDVPPKGIINPGLNESVCHKVMDLKPNVSYEFRVGSKASHSRPFISNFSNTVVIKTQDSNYDDKPKHYIHDAGLQTGLIGLIVGGVVVLILVAIALVAIILNRKKSSSKKEGEALELQNNVVNGLVEGKFNKAMCPTPARSECDPNENGKCYPNSAVESPQNLTHIYATPRKPDVVSDTQAQVECLYQNVSVGKKGSQKGGRLSLRGSRSSQPTSQAEDYLYQNVNRNSQPQQGSCNGGVPQLIGVDGTVYAQLSFHGTSSPSTGHYDYPVRRTEVLTPYAVVNFRLKAPPLEDEDEVQYIT